MKIYTLKLKTASTTNYSLYDGTTLVSDADLTTLFATEGEAYFTIDLNSLTPTNLTSLTVVNSSDTAVITNTGLALVDGKNFKGVWGDSATSFTSFTQLPAYGLDEGQLSALVSKMGEGKIKTIVLPEGGSINLRTDTTYGLGDNFVGMVKLEASSSTQRTEVYTGNLAGLNYNPFSFQLGASGRMTEAILWIPPVNDSFSNYPRGVAFYPLGHGKGLRIATFHWGGDNNTLDYNYGNEVYGVPTGIIDNLNYNYADYALSAKQGKVLKDLIDSLVIKASGAPTTSTVGTVGMLYEDTTNGKLYQCTAITPGTDPDPTTYTWAEVGGGGSGIPTDATFWGRSYDAVNNKVNGDIKVGTHVIGTSNGTLYFGTASGGWYNKAFGISNIGDPAFYKNLSMSSNKIIDLADPTSAQSAATKNYVDSIYPVGAVFTSTSATAPTIAGGTWTEIGTQTIGSSTVHYYERTA